MKNVFKEQRKNERMLYKKFRETMVGRRAQKKKEKRQAKKYSKTSKKNSIKTRKTTTKKTKQALEKIEEHHLKRTKPNKNLQEKRAL